jgi:hypothetical protein
MTFDQWLDEHFSADQTYPDAFYAAEDAWIAATEPQHIATAPMDGTRILLFASGKWSFGNYSLDKKKWFCDNTSWSQPTHWLPTPRNPE